MGNVNITIKEIQKISSPDFGYYVVVESEDYRKDMTIFGDNFQCDNCDYKEISCTVYESFEAFETVGWSNALLWHFVFTCEDDLYWKNRNKQTNKKID